jgi:hypothetical protein
MIETLLEKAAKVLSENAREHISKKNFAEPEKKTKNNPAGHGAYPIPDKAHARNALARVSQFGSSAEKAEVRAKVHAKYPDIGKEKKAEHFVEQDHPAKVKEIYQALEKEHPEYSAGKKARIANSTFNKMHKKASNQRTTPGFTNAIGMKRTQPNYLDISAKKIASFNEELKDLLTKRQ